MGLINTNSNGNGLHNTQSENIPYNFYNNHQVKGGNVKRKTLGVHFTKNDIGDT